MDRVFAADLDLHRGQRVRVMGWLHRLRRLSKVTFLIVRDVSGMAQAAFATAEALGNLVEESVIELEGEVVENSDAPGGVEIHDGALTMISEAQERTPFALYRPTLNARLPTILDQAAVALRHPMSRARWELAAASMAGFRNALDQLGFTEIQTPKIVASSTESGANVFSLDYFSRPAFLAQSPQFYKQMLVGVFERVFEVGPAFRAEPHDTPRHLSEYVSLDAEMGFIEDHTSVMAVLREVIVGMVDAVAQHTRAVELLGTRLPQVPDTIPSIHFTSATEMLSDATGEDVTEEPDLAPAHERWLSEWALRQHGSEFLFVLGYPMSKRPFYTHPDPQRPTFSNSFDLLFRGPELATGGQRLHRYDDYVAALASRGESIEPYEGYLKAFRHGMPPHGGFAIGLERWMARLLQVANVREVTLFPRDLNRLVP